MTHPRHHCLIWSDYSFLLQSLHHLPFWNWHCERLFFIQHDNCPQHCSYNANVVYFLFRSNTSCTLHGEIKMQLCVPWRLQVAVQNGGYERATNHRGEAPAARAERIGLRCGQFKRLLYFSLSSSRQLIIVNKNDPLQICFCILTRVRWLCSLVTIEYNKKRALIYQWNVVEDKEAKLTCGQREKFM